MAIAINRDNHKHLTHHKILIYLRNTETVRTTLVDTQIYLKIEASIEANH